MKKELKQAKNKKKNIFSFPRVFALLTIITFVIGFWLAPPAIIINEKVSSHSWKDIGQYLAIAAAALILFSSIFAMICGITSMKIKRISPGFGGKGAMGAMIPLTLIVIAAITLGVLQVMGQTDFDIKNYEYFCAGLAIIVAMIQFILATVIYNKSKINKTVE